MPLVPKYQRFFVRNGLEQADAARVQAWPMAALNFASVVVLGLLVAGWLVRQLTRPLARAAELAREIEQGNLHTMCTTITATKWGGAAAQPQCRVTDLMGEITASSSEQRDGISQANQAVSNLDQMTQQNAALVEESSATATSMNEQTQRLTQGVAVFDMGQGAITAASA